MSAVTQTSRGPMRSAIQSSAASAPPVTKTTFTIGSWLGRMPPSETRCTRSRWRWATRSVSSRTGQASAST